MSNIEEHEVYNLLKNTRKIKATIKMIEAYSSLAEVLEQPTEQYINQRLINLQSLAAIIEIWRAFITEEERMIVDRHIIEDVDWRRFGIEYINRWDAENVRSESTFKRKQSMLIQKIAHYTNQSFPTEFIMLVKTKVNSAEERLDEYD